MAFEGIDDDIPMDKPADYYKDEYGICPHCKHKLSEEEMERKRCSKCLQKLSGKTQDLTRKGSSNCELAAYIIAKLIISAFLILICCLCLKIIIPVLLFLFVWWLSDLDYKAYVKQRARYNNDILHEMGKDREARKSRGRWYD